MPTQTDSASGAVKGEIVAPSSDDDLIELLTVFQIPDGQISATQLCEPPTMVGPPQPGKSFAVQYISIFCWVPQGQQAHCMINANAGGQWFALFPQGTFSGHEVYVGSQVTNFVIPPTGAAFSVNRSTPTGASNVSIHFAGTFF